MAENTPFFVVGPGRSGSTLLRLILAGHSRIEIPPETWFIGPLVEQMPLNRTLSRDEVIEAVDIMTNNYRWPDMGIAAKYFRDCALALDEPNLVAVINLVYLDHLRRSGKPRFGDKTPPYIDIIPELCALYPSAKFINLVRDGRDVAISHIELKWARRCYDRDFVWTQCMRRRDEYRHSPFDDRILDVKYEDLVADLEPTVRRICAFLEEDFEDGMLAFKDRIDAVPQRERSIHGKLGKPVSRDAIGQWRSKLSALECFIMESCMHRELRQWEYPLRFSHRAWRPILGLSRQLLLGIGPLLRRGTLFLRRRNLMPQNIYI